ncbi:hypothetical protein Bca101_061163 [Brassica carinata]
MKSPNSQTSATDLGLHETSVPELKAGSAPSSLQDQTEKTQAPTLPQSSPLKALDAAARWKGFVKKYSTKMEPEQTPFFLDSGEACVRIPNSVIERNKKSWDSFILGQFYEEPSPRGAVHAIINEIWSKHKRDISVSKMEGYAFLFRVPCPNARRRILSQSLWQIDGQTMFVAKWSPGLLQEKPKLSSVPVWLEFTRVPLQFFNRDALKEIAGLVEHPIDLHPSTENLTNIEVARVYTIIDPRKPLQEFVNAQFETGEIRRIQVSSRWLSSLCSYCKKVCHTISRCKTAPTTCLTCNSVKHSTELCPRNKPKQRQGKAPVKSLLPIVSKTTQVYRPKASKDPGPSHTKEHVTPQENTALTVEPIKESKDPGPSMLKAPSNPQENEAFIEEPIKEPLQASRIAKKSFAEVSSSPPRKESLAVVS